MFPFYVNRYKVAIILSHLPYAIIREYNLTQFDTHSIKCTEIFVFNYYVNNVQFSPTKLIKNLLTTSILNKIFGRP